MTDSKKSSEDSSSISTNIEDALVIESKPSPEPEQQPKQTKTGALWFFTFINFILVLGLGGAAYWYYTQIAGNESEKQNAVQSLEQRLADQSQVSTSEIRQLTRNIQSVETALDTVKQNNDQALAQAQANINSNAAMTDALGKRLAEMSGRRPSDWLLAEANYLVNMAGRKVYLENDIRTAMTLLKEADARLEDLNDPSLFPVRALIAGDIQSLNQVNPVSTDSIALALAGMLPKVGELPLDKLQLPERIEQDLALSEDISDWRENAVLTWRAIVDDLISIDYQDEPLEPYLAERQQWLIEQQLKHSLTQAQTAALNEQAELYRTSMQQAIALMVEHYQLDNSQVSQFLVALQELQNTDFSRNLPQKLNSQESLKDIIKLRIQGLFNNSLEPADDTPEEAPGTQS